MKTLIQYMTEWRNEFSPQCIVVIGGTKVDRDDWIANNADELYFERSTRFTDYLHYEETLMYNKLHVEYIAKDILRACSKKAVVGDDIRTQGQALQRWVDENQVIMDAICDCSVIGSPHIDLSQVKWKGFIRQWVNRFDWAIESQKSQIEEEFVTAFEKEYFDKLFSNYDFFSVKGKAKDYYRKEFALRLGNVLDRIEFKDPTDLLVSLSGEYSEVEAQIAGICGQTHAIKTVNLQKV